MTHLYMMLPMKFQVGSPDEVNARLEGPEVRAESVAELKTWLGRGDQIVGYTGSGRYTGERLCDLAARANISLEDFAYDLMLREREHHAVIFPWQVDPEDATQTVTRTATHPRMMIASDGIFNIPHPHPRGFGCFARVLGHFVRERGLLTLEEAIYKMSGFPARRFNIPDRGELAVGKAADLVVLIPIRWRRDLRLKIPRCRQSVFRMFLSTASPSLPMGNLQVRCPVRCCAERDF